MSKIWLPPTEYEKNVLDIEPSTRTRLLPDGRRMAESRITLSREWIEQMWQGYRCAACLEDVRHLGPYPDRCPLCGFPIKEQQARQLALDFKGERPVGPQDSLVDRETEYLSRHFHEPKAQMVVPKSKVRKRGNNK
jgi:hypothetical protein